MQPSLHIGNYTLLYRIGYGSFASVYMGIHDLIGFPVAIKQIKREIISTEKEKIRLSREISIMKMTMHQYIAELFEIIDNEDEPYIYLVMELVSNGSIKSMLIPDQPLEEELARKIFSQLIIAVGHLHFNLKIIHRDLKAENVLLDKNKNIRLIDFGLSTTLMMNSADIQRTACGSPAYAAPEIIVHDSYSESADIWSLGILLYLMTTGHFPFDTNSVTKLLNDIVSLPIEIPTNLSAELQDLLSNILQKNPKLRISLVDIMKHPWFTSYGYFSIIPQDFSDMQQNKHLIHASAHKSSPINDPTISPISAAQSFTNFRKYKSLNPSSIVANIDQQYKSCFDSLIIDDSIDLQIIDELRKKNIDIQSLKSSLMNHEMTQVTACYRIMRRAKIMENFDVNYCININGVNGNYTNSYMSLNNFVHSKSDPPIYRFSTYPKNELNSNSLATDAAKFVLLPQHKTSQRKNVQSTNAKIKQSPYQQSNIPTKLLPRPDIKKKKLTRSVSKNPGGLEAYHQQIRHLQATNQQQHQQPRKLPILKEQQQQQQ